MSRNYPDPVNDGSNQIERAREYRPPTFFDRDEPGGAQTCPHCCRRMTEHSRENVYRCPYCNISVPK